MGNGRQAKKKGRPGHERPKSREETPKEGYDNTSQARDVALQKYGCIAAFSNANFAELCLQKRGARRTAAFGADVSRTKKGRSFAERPKSREETPKVGCGEW